MIKASNLRQVDHAIDTLFADRWSPRAMSGADIEDAELFVLFEAARWAPSASNHQPWRMLYARRSSAHWPLFFDAMIDFNKNWTKNAAALVLFISKTVDDKGRAQHTHAFDCGAAWENFALQGSLRGLVVHGMYGFDQDAIRAALQIPDEYHINALAAVGKPAPAETLPEALAQREHPNSRRPLSETINEGPFKL